MTDTNQKKLGSTLWGIADQLRGAMDADDLGLTRFDGHLGGAVRMGVLV
jgi:hypothetical protein